MQLLVISGRLDAGGNIGMLGSFTYQDRDLIQHESRVGMPERLTP